MAEWLYEAGIGEARAALVEDGEIVEARIEREGKGPRVGAIVGARLVETGREKPYAAGFRRCLDQGEKVALVGGAGVVRHTSQTS